MTVFNSKIRSSKQITLLVFFAAILFSGSVKGQQDAQYTQYMYNTTSVNPGYAGSRGHLSIVGLHRSQWVGLDGAPRTQTLSINSPIGYRGVGLGFSVINDAIGPTSETNIDVDFSYTLQLSREARLSFGLKAGGQLLDIRFSELNQDTSGGIDLTMQQDIQNRFSPNIGAGVYYHNSTFYAGLSVPRIIETSHFESSSLSTAKEQMNLYFITGSVFNLNSDTKFKPTLLLKAVQGAPLQADLSANFMFQDKFVLGAAYRWDAALSALVGFQVSEELMIGLSYDREVTALGGAMFNDGSFEVILRYDFIRVLDNLKSPRFF